MFTITLDGIELTGDDIDFVTAEDENGNPTEDFINAHSYTVTLTDSGFDKAEAAEIFVTADGLDATTYESILEIIQPT
ncbi:MBG domain-containing protein [Nostoc punctiforme]|jgi:hypothetical protein|uniref:MBG domain-containing protein n=1 Tax=Nostoc punctiforme (strain ATCC 29133 / PCC 73102) TaxID=63737 RepID=B2IT50_NOSP7|nr:MBG domain-containing protein [Nostoc punctiforme]ACC79548.1 hypothetical protein Npun_R0809 [Nostoc punctiforme PCC 73102]